MKHVLFYSHNEGSFFSFLSNTLHELHSLRWKIYWQKKAITEQAKNNTRIPHAVRAQYCSCSHPAPRHLSRIGVCLQSREISCRAHALTMTKNLNRRTLPLCCHRMNAGGRHLYQNMLLEFMEFASIPPLFQPYSYSDVRIFSQLTLNFSCHRCCTFGYRISATHGGSHATEKATRPTGANDLPRAWNKNRRSPLF